jgi:hypothetical protein
MDGGVRNEAAGAVLASVRQRTDSVLQHVHSGANAAEQCNAEPCPQASRARAPVTPTTMHDPWLSMGRRKITMKTFCLLIAAALVTGCGSMTYRPVQETDFGYLVNEGCTRKGDRFSVIAQINSASRETIVLWDGYDGSRTIAVRLPEQGFASRMQDKLGKSRYSVASEKLNELRASGTPVAVTMRCEAAGMAPAADRFSYLENGQRVQFEF